MNKKQNTKPDVNAVGAHDCARKNRNISNKPNANIVGVAPLGDPYSRGITLIALIITIIVMLILVGVSVTMAIKGDLFGITKRAAKRTEKEKNAEQEFANGRIKIDNTWYDSLEDYVEGRPSEDQNESNIKFIYEPKGWTNGKVKVKIESKEDKGQLQYSMDGVTWTNYTEEIEVENNGTRRIYAREVNDIEEEVETVVDKIDTEDPEITITSPSQTTTSINLKVGVTDGASGISKIEWYYKILAETDDKYQKLTEDKYADMNGVKAGKTEVEETKTISGLEKGTTYSIYVVVYDVAGNKAESVLEQQTIKSLLGRHVKIGEEDYIVLYEPGEKIQIGDKEYEIENPQLISANVLEPDNVYLGYEDKQVNWEDANVISEADIDGSGSLDNIEKAIYSYNHAVETLNKKCEDLVGNTNQDIVSVRSVGCNPIDPNNDTSTYYESDFLKNNPSNNRGFYNGKAKVGDKMYEVDRVRVGREDFRSENQQAYWLASRTADSGTNVSSFLIYCMTSSSSWTVKYIFQIGKTVDLWGTYNVDVQHLGVRPVITLKSDALSKYLDL